MHSSRALRGVVTLASVVLAAFASAGALAAPTPAQIAKMNHALENSRQARVTTRTGRLVVIGARVDTSGVRWGEIVDRGGADSLQTPERLDWQEVVALDRAVSGWRRYSREGAIKVGAVAAVVTGVGTAIAGAGLESVGFAVIGGVIGVGVGAAGGAIIGAAKSDWQQVYPVPTNASVWRRLTDLLNPLF